MASDVFGSSAQSDLDLPMTNGLNRDLPRFSIKEVGFFEGPEKLLEVWFDLYPLDNDKESCDGINGRDKGLRVVSRSKWEELLRLVSCEILSSCHNDHMDAYLLSESSLFISNNRFVLKTCGTTTLLYAVKPLLQLVSDHYPASKVVAFFYSHRNFQKPQLQSHPHNSFEEEAHYLDKIFEDGAAYALGRINGDVWYLYTVCGPQLVGDSDQTLEVLMTDLNPDIMALYSPVAYSSEKQLILDTGIDQIVPGAKLDAKMFNPCGFSVNAIIKGDKYFTIHVTPQVECAWVSFETNLVISSHLAILAKVISIFKPGSFTVSLFVSKNVKIDEPLVDLGDEKLVAGYHCKDKQFCCFYSYNLMFGQFTLADKDN